MKTSVSLLFITVLLTGCSSDTETSELNTPGLTVEIPEHLLGFENLTAFSTETEPEYSIRFEKDLTIDNTGDLYFGYFYNVAIDDEDRLIIPGQNRVFHIFNPDGALAETIGGTGSGPGEFQNFSITKPVVANDRLYVFDQSLQRITSFNLNDYSVDNIILISPDNWAHIESLNGKIPGQWNFFVRDDGIILIGFSQSNMIDAGDTENYISYYQMNSDGELVSDMIFEHKQVYISSGIGPSAPSNPTDPRLPSDNGPLVTVSKNGTVYSAWTDEFLITVTGPDGEYKRSIYYPFTRSPLNPEEIIENAYSTYEPSTLRTRSLRDADYPEEWPALTDMIVDDQNRLWIATITDEDSRYEWWVLNESGSLLAKFQWPGNRLFRHFEQKQVRVIKNNFLYAYEPASEENAMEGGIVRYRIELTPN